MPGCPLRRTCARPADGASRSKADQKPKRGGLTADLTFEAYAFSCGSWLASDGGLIADRFFPDVTGSNCRSEPARDSGLIGGEILAGVHIHSCGHGGYRFRSYSESLGKAPSNQALLPLSSGASPGLGIPSLRSCSVGPPRSAIHGRARLTRHPCRVAHCAEPAFGLPMGQEDQDQDQDQKQIKCKKSRLPVQPSASKHCSIERRCVSAYKPNSSMVERPRACSNACLFECSP